MTKRPVSISHLVFGLIFLGVTVLWVVGAATDADAPDIAALAPAVLIAAGVIGLVVTVVNSRRRQPAAPTEYPAYADTTTDVSTDVTTEREEQS